MSMGYTKAQLAHILQVIARNLPKPKVRLYVEETMAREEETLVDVVTLECYHRDGGIEGWLLQVMQEIEGLPLIEEGTVIRATLRNQDLLPAFLQELKRIGGEIPQEVPRAWPDEDAEYWISEQAVWDGNDLIIALNDLAPEGWYFGPHPGDGSDFGFWQEIEHG